MLKKLLKDDITHSARQTSKKILISNLYHTHRSHNKIWCLKFSRIHYCIINTFSFFKDILLIMLLQLSNFFSPRYSPPTCTTFPPAFPPLRSCPWVIHISSLASPFPILFLTSLCLFCTYHLCFLFSVPFSPLSHSPTNNPPCDLAFCESVPVLVVCLVNFCFCFCFFRVGCW